MFFPALAKGLKTLLKLTGQLLECLVKQYLQDNKFDEISHMISLALKSKLLLPSSCSNYPKNNRALDLIINDPIELTEEKIQPIQKKSLILSLKFFLSLTKLHLIRVYGMIFFILKMQWTGLTYD